LAFGVLVVSADAACRKGAVAWYAGGMQQKAEKIWELVYQDFNRPNEVFQMSAVVGTQQASREVVRRLLSNVSLLRNSAKVPDGLVSAIRADVFLAETTGWMTVQACQQVQELLDAIV
jgi:hypothetical protein